MERKYIYATVIAVAAGLTALAQNAEGNVPVVITPTITPPAEFTPTPDSFSISTETVTQTPTSIPEIPYNYEGLDFSKTGFTLLPSYDLQKSIGHIVPGHTLYADIPLPLIEPGFGTEEQNSIFIKSAEDHSKGNPYFVIMTESANHLIVYFHSRQWNSPGDFAREVAGFTFKNPEDYDKVMGQKVTITIDGSEIDAEIVSAINLTTEYFDSKDPWNINNDLILYANTEALGIPESIRNDTTPGVMYLTIVGCQNINPGDITDYELPGAEAANDANRALLTIKFNIPTK